MGVANHKSILNLGVFMLVAVMTNASLNFVGHRFEVVTRRTKFDLKKAEAREHILIGLKKALDHIETVREILLINDVDPDEVYGEINPKNTPNSTY